VHRHSHEAEATNTETRGQTTTTKRRAGPRGHAGTTKKGEETGWTTDTKGRRRGHGDTPARPLRRRRASSVTEDEGTGRERETHQDEGHGAKAAVSSPPRSTTSQGHEHGHGVRQQRDNVIGCSDVAGLAPPPPGPAEVTRKRSRTTTRPGRRHEPSAKIRARWILYEDHRAGGKDLPTSASRCESWTSVSAGAANCTQDPSQRLRASKIRQGTRCSQGPRRPARVRDDQPGSATTSQGPRPRPLRRAAAFLWARVRGGSQDLRRTREP
jgi:hypothetical protein